jgi:hypothetical protein
MASRVIQLCDAIAAAITAEFQGTAPGEFGEAFAAVAESNFPRTVLEGLDAFAVYVTPVSVAGERSTRESVDHQTVVDVFVLDPFLSKPDQSEAAKRTFLEKAERLRDFLESEISPGGDALDVALADVEHDPLLDPDFVRSQPRICLSVITCTYLSSRYAGESETE